VPSKSAKQHRFMQAVAHSPSFAKKAEVSQSVGKDFSAADKGKTFNKGDAIMLKKGFKNGGKVKRFNEGGLSEEQKKWLDGADATDPHILSRMRSAVPDKAPVEERVITPVSRPPSGPLKLRLGTDRGDSIGEYEKPSDRGDSIGEYEKPSDRGDSIGEYEKPSPKVTSRWADGTPRTQKQEDDYVKGLGASNPPKKPSPKVSTAYRDEGKNHPPKVSTAYRDEGKNHPAKKPSPEVSTEGMSKVAIGAGAAGTAAGLGAAALAAKKGKFKPARNYLRNLLARTRNKPPANPPVNKILKEAHSRIIREGRERKAFEERALDTMRGEGGLKKGGKVTKHMGFRKGGSSMKESKAMMGKEVAFMKKKGAPASMIKHEKAEMGMKKGGMAGYAKGGGIESRGKTKGTVVRMASGGSVSARADGIAQRGKTKFRVY
jgi:hypothetical protein